LPATLNDPIISVDQTAPEKLLNSMKGSFQIKKKPIQTMTYENIRTI